jgi:hypothetical protein
VDWADVLAGTAAGAGIAILYSKHEAKKVLSDDELITRHNGDAEEIARRMAAEAEAEGEETENPTPAFSM